MFFRRIQFSFRTQFPLFKVLLLHCEPTNCKMKSKPVTHEKMQSYFLLALKTSDVFFIFVKYETTTRLTE